MATRHGGGGRWTLALLAAAVAMAGCSRSRTNIAAPGTTTTRPATTTNMTLDPKQEVIVAYENELKQYGRVSDDPNGRPDDPIMIATMTPGFARQIELNLFGLRSLHRYTKGDVLIHPQQVDIQGTTATLLVCSRDDSDQYDQSGHDVSAHPGVGTPMQVKAVLIQSADARWLLDQNAPTGKGCSM